jgi:hypothetical protein
LESDEDGNIDLFFTCKTSVWSNEYVAQQKRLLISGMEPERRSFLPEKNKIADIFNAQYHLGKQRQ